MYLYIYPNKRVNNLICVLISLFASVITPKQCIFDIYGVDVLEFCLNYSNYNDDDLLFVLQNDIQIFKIKREINIHKQLLLKEKIVENMLKIFGYDFSYDFK